MWRELTLAIDSLSWEYFHEVGGEERTDGRGDVQRSGGKKAGVRKQREFFLNQCRLVIPVCLQFTVHTCCYHWCTDKWLWSARPRESCRFVVKWRSKEHHTAGDKTRNPGKRTHAHHSAAPSWQPMSSQIKTAYEEPFASLPCQSDCLEHLRALTRAQEYKTRETGRWQDLVITAAGGGRGRMAGRRATGACWGAEDGSARRQEDAEGTKLSEARWGEGGCQVKQIKNKRQRWAIKIAEEEEEWEPSHYSY